MGTRIITKSAQFIEKDWPEKVDRAISRQSTMMKEIQDFVVGVKESVGDLTESIKVLGGEIEKVRVEQESIKDSLKVIETNLSLTNDNVKGRAEEQKELWEIHNKLHAENKGLLSSIFGRWKD